MTTPTPQFDAFEEAQRVGDPQLTLNDDDLYEDVIRVRIEQPLKMSPAPSEDWIDAAHRLVRASTNNQVSVQLQGGAAVLRGEVALVSLESTFDLIDQALEHINEQYYPARYNKEKAAWERWRDAKAKLAELKKDHRLRGPVINYLGPARRGE